MPYDHIEQIGDRSDERFALGLGARNVAGIMVAMFPMLLLSGSWPVSYTHLTLPTNREV